LLAGILPTLKYRHLQFEYMTPVERYKTLSQTLSKLRGSHFQIHLQGVDEIIMSLGSVLFEACNTSFQLHLQINPEAFVNKYNWAQMITGPVLSACVNSPILFGNELWAETRIALFKQSVDTRSSEKLLRHTSPRVYFGNGWLQHSPAELWKNDIMNFPLLVTSDDFEDSKAVFENGQIPNLRAIRLHNGTTYTWNRMCYGDDKPNPHLRIECRYLPSGPTIIDEIANFAFWVGLMNAEPPEGGEFWKNIDFKSAKNNFIKAARMGLDTIFQWFGKNISAKELILETLLPLAKTGLRKQKVAENDIERYLSVFEKRVKNEITGASWTVENFRNLSKKYGQVIAEKEITRQMLAYQKDNTPLYEWENIPTDFYPKTNHEPTIEQIMTHDILCIHENDSLELVEKILIWKNIHHLPIEDYQGNLVGMITDKIMQKVKAENNETYCYARDIMMTDLITVEANATVQTAIQLMRNHDLTYLPVVFNHKLIGIITENDL
jgi:CBS domain-containing protein